MVCLPNRVWSIRFSSMNEIEGLGVSLGAVLGQSHQCVRNASHDLIHQGVAGGRKSTTQGHLADLPVDNGNRQRGLLQGQPFDEMCDFGG